MNRAGGPSGFVRIISGSLRGRRIAVPQGHSIRPTTDRVREALFSLLVSRLGTFEGLNVADLFAGTGACGLEALSRGAARATFVERSRPVCAALHATVQALDLTSRAQVLNIDALQLAAPAAPFDLVFLDPPFDEGLLARSLDRLHQAKALASSALCVLEEDAARCIDLQQVWHLEDERRYGQVSIRLIRPVA